MAGFEACPASVQNGAPSGPRSFWDARDRLWKVWWLWGIPLAWATSALILLAEYLRQRGLHAAGDFCDVARLAVYWFWCRETWRASTKVSSPVWTALSRLALAGGLVVTVLS